MACAKAKTCKVEFKVSVPAGVEHVYVCGSVKGLGEWELKDALELTYCETCGKFTGSKMLPVDTTFEFKVLADKSWAAVEKGLWHEDLPNHTYTATKGLVVEVGVSNFN